MRGEQETGVRLFLDGVGGEGAFDQFPPAVRANLMDNAPELSFVLGRGLALQAPPEEVFSTIECDDAARVTAPALVLRGEQSPPLFGPISNELESCLSATEGETIPGVSHDLRNPPAFTEAVLGFLAEH